MGSCCGISQKDSAPQQFNFSPSEIQSDNNFNTQFKASKVPTHETTLQKDFKFGKTLGHGSFGTVRIAQRRLQEGGEVVGSKKFAVKTIFKEKIKSEMHLLKREIEILRKCDHPNIIRSYYTYEDTKYLHIIMEYCEGGELFDRIIKKQKLTEQEAAVLFEKMLRAVKHLHENNICHRDIKPENFLFETNEEDSEIKLIDFGLACKFG